MGENTYNTKMMIVMRRDLKMRKGKIAAQAGHACVEAVLTALCKANCLNDLESGPHGIEFKHEIVPASYVSEWLQNGQAKVCVYVDSEEELIAIAKASEEKGIIAAMITDAGMTEFHGVPTKTCLALEPLPVDVADQITGHLPLY